MSSGYVSKDGKTVSFEVNLGGIVGTLIIVHMDKNADVVDDNDRIMLKFITQDVKHINAQMTTTNTVIISKDYTRVLSHFLRNAADTIETWYPTK